MTAGSAPRASNSARVIAKVVDLICFMALSSILPGILGPILGFIYSICADGFQIGEFHGQSLGKKIMGLQVRNLETGKTATFRDSVIRNAPVGVATFFSIIPFWGWFILFLVGIPLMAIEVYLMVRVDTGHRLGDVMADTEVVQVSDPSEFGHMLTRWYRSLKRKITDPGAK